MLLGLPAALIALLIALPIFAEPTSLNDPFRSLALKIHKRPEEPVCCLKPVTPSEPVDHGILLSFEEWKLKQQEIQEDKVAQSNEQNSSNDSSSLVDGTVSGENGSGSDPTILSPINSDSYDAPNAGQGLSGPRLKVPLTDRFNYASLDCSARVHTAHRSAKSPSSILSSKKDRYMLSPCDKSKEKQFVVVELCDDIRIDTVQLANFEFFSGVFKDFTVSVAKTYSTDPDSWTFVSNYRAKNIRGVQSFQHHPSLRDFYRFIRIDFLSHYGNEYYCPVSLLRVYGLTHLEEWKWDIWEAESRDKQANLQQRQRDANSHEEASDATSSISEPASHPSGVNLAAERTNNSRLEPAKNDSPGISAISIAPKADLQSQELPSVTLTGSGSFQLPPIEIIPYSTDTYISSLSSITQTPSPTQSPHYVSNINFPSAPSTGSTSFIPSDAISIDINAATNVPPTESPTSIPGTQTIIVPTSSPSASAMPVNPHPLPPSAKGGESVYRTIMNRLVEVEQNHTLYMRYIEQQNVAVSNVIKRLGEDVGRLEGISRAQYLTYQRNLQDWEKQRYQLEMEYGDLISRIENLSEEIILEKRLSVVQLCLLLAVLVFMGLTRGSRPETIYGPGRSRFNQSVKEWGKRHFRLSGDWVGGDRYGDKDLDRIVNRSPSSSVTRTPPPTSRPKPPSAKSYPPHLNLRDDNNFQNEFQFPSSSLKIETSQNNTRLFEPLQLNTSPVYNVSADQLNRRRPTSNPRTRVPSLRTTPSRRNNKPATPFSANFRPQLLRCNSHGISSISQSGSWSPAIMPKSAKRWARTAHLHEVKTAVGPMHSAALPSHSHHRRRKTSGENISPTHDRDRDKTPKEFEFNRENIDIFPESTSRSLLFKKASAEFVTQIVVDPSELTSTSIPVLKQEQHSDDGDLWMDTDSFDDSEFEPDQPVLNI